MSERQRIITSTSDIGLVNEHHGELSADRTIVRREKLAHELLGGALSDFFIALYSRDFVQVGKLKHRVLPVSVCFSRRDLGGLVVNGAHAS